MTRRLVGAAAAAVVVVLLLSQLLLAGIASSSLEGTLSRHGRVESVSVSAFPAIELLWHQADSVKIRMATFTSGAGTLNRLLGQIGGIGTLGVSVAAMHTGLLNLTDVRLSKSGEELTAEARISSSALDWAIPFLRSITFVSSGGGTLTVQGTTTIFGVSGTATVEPRDGRLVVVPNLPLIGGALAVTVFSDPKLRFQSVSGRAVPGGLAIRADARLS